MQGTRDKRSGGKDDVSLGSLSGVEGGKGEDKMDDISRGCWCMFSVYFLVLLLISNFITVII